MNTPILPHPWSPGMSWGTLTELWVKGGPQQNSSSLLMGMEAMSGMTSKFSSLSQWHCKPASGLWWGRASSLLFADLGSSSCTAADSHRHSHSTSHCNSENAEIFPQGSLLTLQLEADAACLGSGLGVCWPVTFHLALAPWAQQLTLLAQKVNWSRAAITTFTQCRSCGPFWGMGKGCCFQLGQMCNIAIWQELQGETEKERLQQLTIIMPSFSFPHLEEP